MARGRSFGGERCHILGLVKDDTRQRVELAHPRLAREHGLGVRVACFPTLLDSGLAEIDVLGVILAVQLRSEQTIWPGKSPGTLRGKTGRW
jgi:hypothetical protein